MPTNLSAVDLANISLNKLGQRPIQSFTDSNDANARAVNANYQLALAEIRRAHSWNCLLGIAQLTPIVQAQLPVPGAPTSVTAWAPTTAYTSGQFVSYGGYIYQCLVANTSTTNFTNDLTAGFWFQSDYPSWFSPALAGSDYPSGWPYAYQLPSDYELLVTLNDIPTQQIPDEWEIIGLALYCDASQATIKYVQQVTDTTRFDSMLVSALTALLASKLATILREDDGRMAMAFRQEYLQLLSDARVKSGNEHKPRRYTPVQDSTWVGARWRSTNG